MGKKRPMKQMKKLKYKTSRTVVDIVQGPSDPWKVGKIVAGRKDVVKWKCKANHSIYVMFPKAQTPLSGGRTEVSAVGSVAGDIASDAPKGFYSYTVLVQDPKGVFHSVEGNSPPEMVIQ